MLNEDIDESQKIQGKVDWSFHRVETMMKLK
jgi:hypothetical protein